MKEYKCKNCGKKFLRNPSQVRNSKTVCCSKLCRYEFQKIALVGKNNPNYKGLDKYKKCKCGRDKDYRAKVCSVCANRGFSVGSKRNAKIKKEELRKAVAVCTSFSDVAKKLNISRTSVAKYISKYNLNVDHFRPCRQRPIKKSRLLAVGSVKRNAVVKKFILNNNLLKNRCNRCTISDTWQGKPIVLELHHKNGDPTDNRLINLELLCPNCHSQTKTNKGKNARNKKGKRVRQ